MKKYLNFCVVFLVMFLSVIFVYGQTTANNGVSDQTVGMSVTIRKAGNLQIGGNISSNNGALIAETEKTVDGVSIRISFADTNPNQSGEQNLYLNIPVVMRSNSPYEIYASRLNDVNFAGKFDLNDVGINLSGVERNAGEQVSAGSDFISPGFDNFLTSAGSYNSAKSLADLPLGIRGVKILNGSRISIGGNNRSNNFISANLKITVKAADFAWGAYIGTVKLSMATL